ncbi:PREDICTED: uncharacterized protein LOC104770564 isoform X4 [Camelina sativa]|uniref:Uncharacterized protein LOC104770564 isoform X4 n=1 Tax=Camelina sativa TaxID=90675 RepID=A0ABM1RFP2_CAMSA|nr:PREDICTED: uncharacterized protein LOC104770564 isoform X4 [Camelina sativa]
MARRKIKREIRRGRRRVMILTIFYGSMNKIKMKTGTLAKIESRDAIFRYVYQCSWYRRQEQTLCIDDIRHCPGASFIPDCIYMRDADLQH